MEHAQEAVRDRKPAPIATSSSSSATAVSNNSITNNNSNTTSSSPPSRRRSSGNNSSGVIIPLVSNNNQGEAQDQQHQHNNNTTMVQQWFSLFTLVLRILVWPVRRLSEMLFPPFDFDGLSERVTAKASQQFITYLRQVQQQQQQYQIIANSSRTSSQQQQQQQPDGTIAGSGGGGGGNSGASGGGGGAAVVSVSDAWSAVGYAAARRMAADHDGLVFLYLHAPLHAAAHAFCREVLIHGQFLQWLRSDRIVGLGVSIHTAQGLLLARQLHVTSYPFCALLQPTPTTSGGGSSSSSPSSSPRRNQASSSSANHSASSSSAAGTTTSSTAMTTTVTMSLLFRAEGPNLAALHVDQMLPYLQTSLVRHETILAEREANRLQREQEAELRRQQDAEYHAALAADQERERRQQEEADALRKIRDLEEEEKQKAAAALQRARDLVQPEPPAGGGSSGATAIRFVLPTGAKLNRRFYSHQTVAALRAFLLAHFADSGIQIRRIGLSTNFPRKTYNPEDDCEELTLQQAGLCPQAVLMVQDLDA